MFKGKLKLIIIFTLLIAAGGIILSLINQPPASISISKESAPAAYSFTADADGDGLSEAKEIIYGTDPKNPDTDNDGFPDGQEIQNGFDPASPSRVLLSESRPQNLTIQYFQWARRQKNLTDPQLNQELIEQFLTEQNLLSFDLPVVEVNPEKVVSDDPENIRRYLIEVSQISLPQEQVSYQAIAAQIIKGQSAAQLGGIISGIETAKQSFQELTVPSSAENLQKTYLGLLTQLKAMFSQLADAQKDPVRLVLNQKKGAWLAQLAQKLVQQQKQLAQETTIRNKK